jgi:molecular chaperone GrpE (heat shock protein)
LDESLEHEEITGQKNWATDGDSALSQEPEDLQYRLNTIQDQLVQLQDEFTGKLKYDAHKDQIIDKLHQELQEYKQDIVKKHILSIVLDVVKVADDIRKWITYFRSLDVSQRDPVKLFRYLEAIPSDLEDIFYWQGVKPYVSREGAFNPATQRAIKKIPTDDSTKDKTIAKSIRPGYEWEGKVIRQEMVAVYVYQDGTESVDTGNIDE